ncbi:MAG: Amino acid permease [Edaphobacter sp.]|nr:Amino acid permease [Edaphobacter sp.]
MSLFDRVVSRPLGSRNKAAQRVNLPKGMSVFGPDALRLVAYGPESALTVLIPAAMVGRHYTLPLSAAIVALLFLVYFSYSQTIGAFPSRGGSYTVASKSLASEVGLVAGAALMLAPLSLILLKTRCSSAEAEGLRSLKSRSNSLPYWQRMMGRRS